jgi:hypothetical protein
MTTPQLEHAMAQTDKVITFYPPHPPRVATDVYARSHALLCITQNKPCWACGVTHADIVNKTTGHIAPGLAMETHHFWAEDAFTGEGGGLGGIYWPRIQADHADFDWKGSGFDINDPKSWKFFVDSTFNLQVLCSQCHRAAKSVLHWMAGLPDPARGGLIWPVDAGSMGIHHASYPEYRDQRHNRPDTPPFRSELVKPLPVAPHLMVAAAGTDPAVLAKLIPGHAIIAPPS